MTTILSINTGRRAGGSLLSDSLLIFYPNKLFCPERRATGIDLSLTPNTKEFCFVYAVETRLLYTLTKTISVC